MAGAADYLFAEGDANVFAILDGASIEELVDRLCRFKPEYVCLYRGELAPDLVHVAPYLVRLNEKSAFTDWVLDRGWGKHWGIFAVATTDLIAMRQHFRRFLTVHDSEGKPLLFRYYDPRVLRTYLPTCDAQELAELFGPVLNYVLEGETPTELLRFEFAEGKLVRRVKKLGE
jgi:hypothetical protein